MKKGCRLNALWFHHFSPGSSICDEVYLVLKDVLVLLSGGLGAPLGAPLLEGPSDLVPFPILLLLPRG